MINGRVEEVEKAALTLPELLTLKNIPEQQVVIELNGDLVKREIWGTVVLQANDQIEILRFVGGG